MHRFDPCAHTTQLGDGSMNIPSPPTHPTFSSPFFLGRHKQHLAVLRAPTPTVTLTTPPAAVSQQGSTYAHLLPTLGATGAAQMVGKVRAPVPSNVQLQDSTQRDSPPTPLVYSQSHLQDSLSLPQRTPLPSQQVT